MDAISGLAFFNPVGLFTTCTLFLSRQAGMSVVVTTPTRLVTVVTTIVTTYLQLVDSFLSMALNMW
jgi:hypothetical protein